MEELKELARLVSKQKVVNIEVITNSTSKNSKLYKFYDGIISGKFQTENEAAHKLYNTDSNNPSFKKLKYRLEDRLINSLLFIDLNKPHYKDLQRAYYYSQRALSAVNILFGFNVRKPAISIAEKAIKKAIEFEHTEIVLSLSRRLSRHYGAIEGNLKKYNYYKNITHKFLEIYNAEVLASDYYNEIAIYNTMSGAVQNDYEIKEKVQRFAIHLEEFVQRIDTYNFILFAYSVFWFRFVILGDYNGALNLCWEAIDRVENNEKYPSKLAFLFYSRMLTCYTQLNNYNKGEESFRNALKYVDKGASNWFIINRSYLILAFRAKKYQKTYLIFKSVKEHESYNKMPRNLTELWYLNEAYINLFISVGKINTNSNVEKFKLNRFLNNVPIFSKDKRGVNIPILIIQILFHLQQKKYDPIIDKVEALNAYCYRYLKKDDTFRSNCFIKMLLLLPKSNFNRIAVERKSQNLLNKLKSVPLEVARQSAEIEIVPYEDLWEIVLEMLDTKFHKTRDV